MIVLLLMWLLLLVLRLLGGGGEDLDSVEVLNFKIYVFVNIGAAKVNEAFVAVFW
jgi:hypothetical protein